MTDPSPRECRQWLFRMWLIRLFEEKVLRLVSEGIIRGTTHPYVGQEAVAVGACSVLEPSDCTVSTHRGHGHLLAKGGSPKKLMAELFGKVTGYGGGRGGTQHVADFSVGHLGSFGITGGGIPLGTGAALAMRMRRRKSIVVVFFGDGATNQGVFHESLNLAALWRLPVVYLCENNLYAMSTHVREACATEDLARRALAYGIPGVRVDGMDVRAVAEHVGEAAERARRGQGPTLLECLTYRFLGHSKSDQRVYRTREEEEAWRKRDPIVLFSRWCTETQRLREEDVEAVRQEALARVDEAVAFARESPFPAPESAGEGVFTPDPWPN
ncbi:MAG: acetoin:2,6-dichlorophenolindophenol oxidoreductase subunit alpha [Candidatus Binatia bacterium]|nr:MAG: acetoin:2,6-dichlorophenolindophenol oxidoreductase subunit alpha [Candidatus Binatia bacterium]